MKRIFVPTLRAFATTIMQMPPLEGRFDVDKVFLPGKHYARFRFCHSNSVSIWRHSAGSQRFNSACHCFECMRQHRHLLGSGNDNACRPGDGGGSRIAAGDCRKLRVEERISSRLIGTFGGSEQTSPLRMPLEGQSRSQCPVPSS